MTPSTYSLQMRTWADQDPAFDQWSTCATATSPLQLPSTTGVEIAGDYRIVSNRTGRTLRRWHHQP